MSAISGTMDGSFFGISRTKEQPKAIKRTEAIPEIANSKNCDFIGTKEACMDIRANYFNDFDFSIDGINTNLKDVIGKKPEGDSFMKYIFEKRQILSKIPGFSFQELAACGSLIGSIEYIGKITKDYISRRGGGKEQNKDIIDLLESNFINHCFYYVEKSMKEYNDRMFDFFKNFYSKRYIEVGKKQRPIPQEQIDYLRNTIASLAEYSRNMTMQYKNVIREKVLGKGFYDDKATEITTRQIKKPYVEKKTVDGIMNRVRNLLHIN
ncbi:MAG: hypothetical protein PHS92_03480 [Candidatus Gracilibacteria bacterium]|nr:hypothetical protein [Candidatus Gracilibacteria bacterium]